MSGDPQEPDYRIRIDDDVVVWIDPSGIDGGGITIKAVGPLGDPVELHATQARALAAALLRLADLDEAEDVN